VVCSMALLRPLRLAALIVVAMAPACTRAAVPPPASGPRTAATPSPSAPATRATLPEGTPLASDSTNRWVTSRPAWLGSRVLPRRPDGFGIAPPTPPILRTRRLATIDVLPPPSSARFSASIGPVPRSVVERSTWRPKCPIPLDSLSYVQMSFWGFDHKPHTGEMIVGSAVVKGVVGVFRSLYQARFPIEEMRVVAMKELHAPPTGDTNNTSSFECREVTLGSMWSQHSYGLAIDINPFQNPYVRGDLVAPELASAYRNRTWRRPGMIFEGDVVTRAFATIGWEWGGRWNSLKDWMHFSRNGH
jgi:hypothetical protein